MTATMTAVDLKETIINALSMIAPEADFEMLGANDNVRETLDIDSCDFLNLLIEMDGILGVETPEADYGKLNSMTDMVDYFSARMG